MRDSCMKVEKPGKCLICNIDYIFLPGIVIMGLGVDRQTLVLGILGKI